MPCAAAALSLSLLLAAGPSAGEPPPSCPDCALWNRAQAPFRIFGNTWYVGVHGLAAVLITSPQGHVLIDGDLPESAPRIAANIGALGFGIKDVKLILNTHVHFDHAGGIAALQRLSGARVAASELSAPVLRRGGSGPDDPQYGMLPPIEKIGEVAVFHDGETLDVGPIAVTAHLTPGHTPGGTSWTWKSCEKARCLDVVYADSLTPVSAPAFEFSRSRQYPNAVADFERSFATLESLPCGILITTHPDASDFWGRVERRSRGDASGLIDAKACARYAAAGRERLRRRLATEGVR
ncbi:MAG TPA: subclass B3 metallo-beta-lactamase [Myxococcales bacterium]|nr:subclass B3 metallo-beta-lactamase [Myxococcales bacterium]